VELTDAVGLREEEGQGEGEEDTLAVTDSVGDTVEVEESVMERVPELETEGLALME
jgi:hypothetical protein